MREIQIRTRIAEHDLQIKMNSIKRLLLKDKVKVSIIFRGREISHAEIGQNILDRVVNDLKDCSEVATKVRQDRQMFVILVSQVGKS